MTDQRTVARKISSFAAPTEEEMVYFDSLPPDERRALLRAEIEKGFAGDLTNRTLDQIIAEARDKSEARRSHNG